MYYSFVQKYALYQVVVVLSEKSLTFNLPEYHFVRTIVHDVVSDKTFQVSGCWTFVCGLGSTSWWDQGTDVCPTRPLALPALILTLTLALTPQPGVDEVATY